LLTDEATPERKKATVKPLTVSVTLRTTNSKHTGTLKTIKLITLKLMGRA
jgi:hypothetical protein